MRVVTHYNVWLQDPEKERITATVKDLILQADREPPNMETIHGVTRSLMQKAFDAGLKQGANDDSTCKDLMKKAFDSGYKQGGIANES